MAKIYLIYNVKNHKKYVGETTNCVSQRFAQHIDSAFRNNENKKTDFYKDIVNEGENVFETFKYKVLLECSDEDRFIKEIEFIEKIKPEYNFMHRNCYLKGIKNTIIEEYKNGLTMTQLKIKYSCRSNLISSIIKNAIKNGECKKHYNLHKSKKVYLFDKNGKVIKHWLSAGDCGLDLNIDRGNIRICCLKNTKENMLYFSAEGYHFKYTKDVPKNMYEIIDKKTNNKITFKTKESLVDFFKEKYPEKNIQYGQLVRNRKSVYGYVVIKLYGHRN